MESEDTLQRINDLELSPQDGAECARVRDANYAEANKMYAFAPRDGQEQTETQAHEWNTLQSWRLRFKRYCTSAFEHNDHGQIKKIETLGKRCADIAKQYGSKFALYHLFTFSTPGDWIEHIDTPDGAFSQACKECLEIDETEV